MCARQGQKCKHCKYCKSWLKQVSWKVNFKCQSCFSCQSCMTRLRHFSLGGSCQMSPQMTCLVAFVRKLKVIYKQTGCYLISYNLQLAYIRNWEVIWPDARQTWYLPKNRGTTFLEAKKLRQKARKSRHFVICDVRKYFEMGFNPLKGFCIYFCYTKEKLHSKFQILNRLCRKLWRRCGNYSESARNFFSENIRHHQKFSATGGRNAHDKCHLWCKRLKGQNGESISPKDS